MPYGKHAGTMANRVAPEKGAAQGPLPRRDTSLRATQAAVEEAMSSAMPGIEHYIQASLQAGLSKGGAANTAPIASSSVEPLPPIHRPKVAPPNGGDSDGRGGEAAGGTPRKGGLVAAKPLSKLDSFFGFTRDQSAAVWDCVEAGEVQLVKAALVRNDPNRPGKLGAASL